MGGSVIGRLAIRAALLFVALGIALAMPTRPLGAQPNRPEPQALTLDPATTALLVLDLSARCDDPAQPCNRLVPVINDSLPTFRASHVLTIYTASASGSGGDLWAGFGPQPPDEFVTYPNGSDKFVGGEIDGLLRERGITTLVITGASANNAVLYTASSATRNYGYDIVIPLDGTVAASDYEHEYTMHQFSVTSGIRERVRFTTLDLISFAS